MARHCGSGSGVATMVSAVGTMLAYHCWAAASGSDGLIRAYPADPFSYSPRASYTAAAVSGPVADVLNSSTP